MPQLQLPIFPEGMTLITSELGFERRGDHVCYFHGQLPVFTHEVKDLATFRMFTSQLIVNGLATQGHISKAFGISITTIKRGTAKYRKGGPSAFFKAPAKRKGHRLTPERLKEAQELLNSGLSHLEVGKQLGVLPDTIRKAIEAGRLHQVKKK